MDVTASNQRLFLLNIGTVVLTLCLELLFATSMASSCSGQYRFDADALLKAEKLRVAADRNHPATPTSRRSYGRINTPSSERLPRFVPDFRSGIDVVVQEYELVREYRCTHPLSR